MGDDALAPEEDWRARPDMDPDFTRMRRPGLPLKVFEVDRSGPQVTPASRRSGTYRRRPLRSATSLGERTDCARRPVERSCSSRPSEPGKTPELLLRAAPYGAAGFTGDPAFSNACAVSVI